MRYLTTTCWVVVKGSISRYAASNLHPEAARRLIRAGAQRAIERLSEARAPAFARPARLDMQFLTADMAEMATWLAGVERRGPRTVALEDDDTLALYKRFVTIIYLTRSLAD
jgi:D-amino peptidase